MLAMYSPKLFCALSLIQSNMYYQKKKCTQEILLDKIIYNSLHQFIIFNPRKVP